MEQRRIAVLGAGAAGIASAYWLDRHHEVTLFEAGSKLGGHTNTVQIDRGPDTGLPVDTGFIVFNERNYPTFVRFLDQLGVRSADSDMSFSFSRASDGFCYSSDVPNGLFARRRHILSPRFWGMVRDILSFKRSALSDLNSGATDGLSLGEYLERCTVGERFKNAYLLPQGAAIWSCPAGQIQDFPATQFLRFFDQHGLLTVSDRPQWRYVCGGSQSYIDAFETSFSGRIRTATPIQSVHRDASGVSIVTVDGDAERFDLLVLATHADQALKLLADPSADESRLLGTWSYSRNRAVLHSDASLMPENRRAWASWNVIADADDTSDITLSYHMNRLQCLDAGQDYLVTLNPTREIAAKDIYYDCIYTHPVYTRDSMASQDPLRALSGQNRTFLAGSYLGYGFHEDAIASAARVASALGVTP